MKKIDVGSGNFSLVDDDDFELLNSFNWQSYNHRRTTIVHRKRLIWESDELPKVIKMHRFILNAKPGQIVDHKDGNALNNQKSNLRFCTYSQNARNAPSRLGSTSRFLGVSKRNDSKKWQAQIQEDGKSYKIGDYDSEVEAALAYNISASFRFREFARLNVISNGL